MALGNGQRRADPPANTPRDPVHSVQVHRPPLEEGSLCLKKPLVSSKVVSFVVSKEVEKAKAASDIFRQLFTGACLQFTPTVVASPGQDLSLLRGSFVPDVLIFVLLGQHTDAEIDDLNAKLGSFGDAHKHTFIAVFYGPSSEQKTRAGLVTAPTSSVIKLSSANMVRPAEEYINAVPHLKFYERDQIPTEAV